MTATMDHIRDRIRQIVEEKFSDNNLLTDVQLHTLMEKDPTGDSWVAFAELFSLIPRLRRLVTKRLNAILAKPPQNPSTPKPTMNSILADALVDSKIVDINPSSPVGNGLRRSIHRETKMPKLPFPGDVLLHLVLDSGAIIHGVSSSLRDKATHFWTVPEVIKEIRDKKSRAALENLPFELRLKEPSDEAMGFICRFAKLTGDFGFLSLTDLKVLALTYMLERQESGDNHLRSKPKKMRSLMAETTNVTASQEGIGKSHVFIQSSISAEIRENEKKDDQIVDEDDDNSDRDSSDCGDDDSEDGVHDDGHGSIIGDVEGQCDREGDKGTTSIEDGDEKQCLLESREELGSDDDWDPDGGAEEIGSNFQDDTICAPEQRVQFLSTARYPMKESSKITDEDFPILGASGSPSPDVKSSSPQDWRAVVATISCDKSEHISTANAPPPPPVSQDKAAVEDQQREMRKRHSALGNNSREQQQALRWERKYPLPQLGAVYGGGTLEDKNPTDVFEGHSKNISEDSVSSQRPTVYKSRILGAAASSGMSSKRDDEEDVDDGGGEWTHPNNISKIRALGMTMNGTRRVDFVEPKEIVSVEVNMPPSPPYAVAEVLSSEITAATNSAISKTYLQNNETKKLRKSKVDILGTGMVARTACVTTDFAMQAVLIQVGLRLLGVEGYQVRRVSQFVLRCNACFLITSDTEKIFCPRCGGAHLSRIAASVDPKTGEQKLYLKKDYRHKLQGTKYSLPKPGAQRKGRFGGELVLREDQMMMGIWAQKTAPKAKEKLSMFGAEVNEKTGCRVAKSTCTVEIGLGRQNPNSTKGRERRGKKKRSIK
tara:strand:+ start:1008 stop:3491 length:2484 start_codon:yes stop_codon:yes gene_type:complete